ncbi:Cryptochrome-like protein cry2 [Pirellula sp. SH-Sr6A]|uniref:cryptochrome/deoxyribodipyrimidine photo-lyase family protein n=1 Tax=Pirellula sp. SH-Sr6A TaxID=1632865 RepID=UPI00078CCD79|nr:deoxyribodipyrimidine photo-lyase [Pirellula sp. SH-Sr6A]AMV31770.1 Cryptochrome-like protein cry2 [Pirellula sp. SH-Sr6A]
MYKPIVQLVWFKRDLRLSDHDPLASASQKGIVIPLFLFEPEFWSQPENSPEHFHFVRQSIFELRESLQKIGADLFVRTGEAIPVLNSLLEQVEIAKIWSHEETASMWTYRRDQSVAKWARNHNISWVEVPSNGVVRKLKSRDGWGRLWQTRMNADLISMPTRLIVPRPLDPGPIPKAKELFPLHATDASEAKQHLQQGGESAGQSYLSSFLTQRGAEYRSRMSSPLSAPNACSRLSPYIAWGCLSIRSVHRSVQSKRIELTEAKWVSKDPAAASWTQSLSSFTSRLSWHCHFIQKLEDEPEIEFRNICSVYDGLRENEFQQDRLEAWMAGRTGYPMIDACMRYLHRERWINFRMRAMLMSFAAYHLWLHWRSPALHLARLFLDFEPGIHYPQCQMQSGVTGINTFRIYSPTKQAMDQDPEGRFIRENIPELARVPKLFIHEPWKMALDDQVRYGCRIGVDYPAPIVEHASAVRFAKNRIYEVRQSEAAREMARQVYEKHGSRKHRDPIPGRPPSTKTSRSALDKTNRTANANRSNQQLFLPGLFDDTEPAPP